MTKCIYWKKDFCTKILCVDIPQYITGHQGENPENEGLPGKADGMSGRRPGGARPSSSG